MCKIDPSLNFHRYHLLTKSVQVRDFSVNKFPEFGITIAALQNCKTDLHTEYPIHN